VKRCNECALFYSDLCEFVGFYLQTVTLSECFKMSLRDRVIEGDDKTEDMTKCAPRTIPELI